MDHRFFTIACLPFAIAMYSSNLWAEVQGDDGGVRNPGGAALVIKTETPQVSKERVDLIQSKRQTDPAAMLEMAQLMIDKRWPQPYSSKDIYALLLDSARLGSDVAAMTLSHLFSTGRSGFPIDSEAGQYWLQRAYLSGNRSAALSIGRALVLKGNCVDGVEPLSYALKGNDFYIKVAAMETLSQCENGVPPAIGQFIPGDLEQKNPALWAKMVILTATPETSRNKEVFKRATLALANSTERLDENITRKTARTLFHDDQGEAKAAAATILLRLGDATLSDETVAIFRDLSLDQQIEFTNKTTNELLRKAAE